MNRTGRSLAIEVTVLLLIQGVVSAAAIIYGFIYDTVGLDRTATEWVYESTPILTVVVLLGCVFVSNQAVAFYISKGDYQRFREKVALLSVLIPPAIVACILPSSIEEAGVVGHMHYFAYIAIIVTQMIVGSFIARETWIFGGREVPGSEQLAQERIRLKILDDVMYIVDCLATDLAGEARHELGKLFESASAKEYQSKAFVVENLQEATELLGQGNGRRAAIPLGRIRKRLWESLLATNFSHHHLLWI